MKTQFDVTNAIIKANCKELGMTSSDKTVLVAISTYFSKDGKVFKSNPSHKTLSETTGCGISTVQRCITKLETLGYISSEQRLDNSKVYTWLTFEREKTQAVTTFMEATKRKQDSKKELKAIRGANMGRNTAKVKQLEQILTTSPDCQNSKDSLKLVKAARSANEYWKDYQPYKDYIASKVTVVHTPPQQAVVKPKPVNSIIARGIQEASPVAPQTVSTTPDWFGDEWDEEEELPF